MSKQVYQNDIIPKAVKQRHIDGVIIKMGVNADRPTDGGAVGVYAYFSTNTGLLSIWDGTQWLETTLT